MDPVSAAIAAGGSILGAGIQYYGAKQANEAAAASVDKQMQFQERMSSTAYQRSMQDMRNSGLNPMLAYQQGGASAPSGAAYNPRSETEAAAATALQLARLKVDIQKTAAETAYIDQQAKNAGSKGAAMQFFATPYHVANSAMRKSYDFAGHAYNSAKSYFFRRQL